ncbi:MAG: dihydrolipoyl dehydrogenase [Planctomycetes bacterium]|nr:dihydrolipoyl dehydrogenase [Planctomycetota bacterium]
MYDIIIIGSGPAGYVAAERAGEQGKSVLLVEKDENLGGVCLNTGCIPTKSMLYSAKLYDHAFHAKDFGVNIEGASFDYPFVKNRTEGIQETLRKGIEGLMKKNKVDVVKGSALIKSAKSVEVDGKVYEGSNLLICTGSRPFVPPIPGLKESDRVVTNVGILAQEKMADHLCVIGAGVIGTEFASLYAMAGKKVTMIEMLPQICGNTDKELAKTVQKKLEGKGVDIHLGAKVTKVDGGTVSFTDRKGAEQSVSADLVLVATGRAVNTDGLGLEAIDLDFDRRGIKVNEKAETNIPGVYAAGDVTGRWQLAHFASRQATVAVNNICGRLDYCRENAVPAVVYTDPEIASVGLTDDLAKEKGVEVKVVKMPLAASGRYLAETNGERGVVKVVICAKSGAVLGVHIVGPGVSEMIAAACAMIETELRARDVEEIIFPHPTVGEVIHDVMFSIH